MRIHANRMMKRCLAALAAGMIAVSTLVGSGVTTQAAEAAESGTITISPQGLDASYTGTFNLYKVATDAGEQTFKRTESFQSYDGQWLDGISKSDDATAKTIAGLLDTYVKNNSIAADYADIKIGVPTTVPYGVYLVRQATSDTVYYDTEPFLVMVPQYTTNADGTITVTKDVTVSPKCEKPTTPPDNPPGGGGDDEDTPATTGKVTFTKTDAVTGIPLQGVVFNLYKEDGTVIGSYTTDANGQIYVDKLPLGNYYFVEQKALDGYVIDQTPQGVMINSWVNQNISMTNTPIPEEEGEIPEEGGEVGEFTGDDSNMVIYGVVAGAAVIALIVWFVWKRRSDKSAQSQDRG